MLDRPAITTREAADVVHSESMSEDRLTAEMAASLAEPVWKAANHRESGATGGFAFVTGSARRSR